MANLMELSELLRQREIDLVVLEQGVDTSTAVGRMFFSILGSIAEFEHALLVERTSEGLVAARARGRVGGQKPKLTRGRPATRRRCTTSSARTGSASTPSLRSRQPMGSRGPRSTATTPATGARTKLPSDLSVQGGKSTRRKSGVSRFLWKLASRNRCGAVGVEGDVAAAGYVDVVAVVLRCLRCVHDGQHPNAAVLGGPGPQ